MKGQTVRRLFFDHRYLLLLLVVTLAVFYKGVTPSFSSDDFVHLENNIHFENLAAASEVFINPYGREYRPLVRLSLWLNHQMGDTALAYKISNLLMHLLCVVLLYGLMLRLGVSRTTAVIASSIFALHPVHTTSVHFILGRTDLLAAVFYLATLYVVAGWKNGRSVISYAITVLLFVAALLSKELSITLVAMMWATLLVQQQSLAFNRLWRTALMLWPFIGLTIFYLLARIYQWRGMESAVAVYTDFSPLNIVRNYVEWTFALVYPLDLYIAREWQLLHTGKFIAAAAITGMLLATLVVYLWRPAVKLAIRSPLLWFGLFWWGITLIPMTGGSSHRWYLYLPSAALCFVVVALWPLTYGVRRKVFAWFFALLLVVYAVETFRQSVAWQKQSLLNEQLILDEETAGMLRHDVIAIANMPFGYQGTFLFTHSAYEEALRVRYGKSPRIVVLNYLNLDDENPVSLSRSDDGISFTITPNAYRYFRLRTLQTHLDKPGIYPQGYFNLRVDQLDKTGRIETFTLLTSAVDIPVYYFDGKQFKPLAD